MGHLQNGSGENSPTLGATLRVDPPLSRVCPGFCPSYFKRRIKTQTVLPAAETAAMLFWALLASGQITMRKVNGWQTLGEKLAAPVDLAA